LQGKLGEEWRCRGLQKGREVEGNRKGGKEREGGSREKRSREKGNMHE
jgi:hypothetical protein